MIRFSKYDRFELLKSCSGKKFDRFSRMGESADFHRRIQIHHFGVPWFDLHCVAGQTTVLIISMFRPEYYARPDHTSFQHGDVNVRIARCRVCAALT